VRAATIDSGPLISLAHLELAKELALFFNGIYVPRAVQLEVNRKHRFRYKLQKLYGTGIYAKCLLADKTNVDLHRIEVTMERRRVSRKPRKGTQTLSSAMRVAPERLA
jgi:hypothetical protein